MKVEDQKMQKLRVIAKGAGLITAVRTVASGEIYVLSLGGGVRALRSVG